MQCEVYLYIEQRGGVYLGGKTMEQRLAPCGLDCGDCGVFRAQSDPQVMERLLTWFREARGINMQPEQVRCGGRFLRNGELRGSIRKRWAG